MLMIGNVAMHRLLNTVEIDRPNNDWSFTILCIVFNILQSVSFFYLFIYLFIY